MTGTIRTYGFAVVGCGVISDTHIDAITQIHNARLVAVCDTREDAARAKAAQYGCEWTTDFESLLQRDDIHIVNIIVPSGLHAKLGIKAAQAGKSVICTKPIDITLEAVDALIDACDQNGVKLGATHQLRGYGVYKRVRQALNSGRLGKPLYANAFVPWYRSDAYYSDGWHGTKALDGGGALINQSIHYVDLLLWLMGDVKSVCGFADALAHDMIEVEDCATAALKFTSGAQGLIQGTTCTYQGHEARLEIHGTLGNAVVVGDQLMLWEVAGEEHTWNPDAGQVGGAADPRKGMSGEAVPAHVEQIRDVIAAIAEDRPPLIDGREARRAVELILSIYESSAKGTIVNLR